MIRVANISKSFGSRSLWSDISFEVNRGEMVAITGPSGSGKSTLISCLGILEHVDRGEILIDGHEVRGFSARRRRMLRRHHLGYLFQNYALIENATVEFNLNIARTARFGRSRNKGVFESVLRRVGLEGRGREMVYRLSGGEQQRVALARLIVKEPSVVLADEPTAALDEDNAKMVVDTLREIAVNGSAIVVATHSRYVMDQCDSSLNCVVGAMGVA